MKFNKSERDFHPNISYTPPCNYYQVSAQENKVLTGSLNGPALIRQQTLFGLSQRFKEKQEIVPGPGTYHNHKKERPINQAINQKAIIRQYKKHSVLSQNKNSPSIPYNQFKIEEEDAEQLRQLLCTEDLNKSSLYLKKKNEGYTFHKSQRRLKIIPERQFKQVAQMQKYRQIQVGQQQPRQKINMREKIKKSIERRNQIIKIINPQFVPSLQLIELVSKRRTRYNPGPGTYNSEDNSQINQNGISFSTSKRFKEQNISLGPGQYKLLEERTKASSFSKSSRILFDKNTLQTDLQHRFYIDPYQNTKKRQTQSIKSKGNSPFGSQIQRFSLLQKQPQIQSNKSKKRSKIEQVVQKRLKKLQNLQKKYTSQSQGLLALSTMASVIQ